MRGDFLFGDFSYIPMRSLAEIIEISLLCLLVYLRAKDAFHPPLLKGCSESPYASEQVYEGIHKVAFIALIKIEV